ncbi:UNVERIFIED_CONTAM: Precursor of CEP14 [Sesamum radiatum]|uniref:Precursor of CEP14 n=1 Tax=Sesamum radiatum TaxID=300843 RepID=A0AAW2T1W4_SESRA
MWLIMFSSSMASVHGRKLLMMNVQVNKDVLSLDDRLYLTSLPKGNVPASAPSKKGHGASTIDEKLIARHLAAVDRILRSVPSPGVGH